MNIYQQEISWERQAPAATCVSSSLEVFKTQVVEALGNHVWSHSWPCLKHIGWQTPWGPFPLDLSWDVTNSTFLISVSQLREKKKKVSQTELLQLKKFKILSLLDMRNPVVHIPSPRKNHGIYSIPDRSIVYISQGFPCRVMESQQPLLIIHSDMTLSSSGRFISTLCLNIFCCSKAP